MNQATSAKPKGMKLWLFRGLAVLLGLAPFVIAEIVLISIGWQAADSIEDPFVGFSKVRPLFVRSADQKQMVIAENRKPLFCAESFGRVKKQNEFRVFCVGGSTVQGRPFAIETAFPKWLELGLSIADPDHFYRVVNCGGVSYASYRLAPIVDEILQYEPDLIILYTGHNEFLEDRTYESIKSMPQLVNDTHGWLSHLRSYNFARSLLVQRPIDQQGNISRFTLPTEVEARLDFAEGLEEYHRDDAWVDAVGQHFKLNLTRMIRACENKGVPVLIVVPVSNLRDAAPFKSELSSDLTPRQSKEFHKLLRSTDRTTVPTQAELRSDLVNLKLAVEIAPRHALAQFRLGQTYIQLGETELAKIHLTHAKEEDICPLRILEPMVETIREVATKEKIPSFDANEFFKMRSSDGLVGAESLVDHVHPSIAGHQRLARSLLDRLVQLDLVPCSNVELDHEFETQLAQDIENHLADLPYLYFELGKDRLKGLRRWASGQVTRRRLSDNEAKIQLEKKKASASEDR